MNNLFTTLMLLLVVSSVLYHAEGHPVLFGNKARKFSHFRIFRKTNNDGNTMITSREQEKKKQNEQVSRRDY